MMVEEECPVCFGPSDMQTRCCRKEVCEACLNEWIAANAETPTCPMCRQNPFHRAPDMDNGFLLVEHVSGHAPQGRKRSSDVLGTAACVGSGIWGAALLLWATRGP